MHAQTEHPPHSIFLALGSNLGDRKANLYAAIDHLRRHIAIRRLSPVYETEPAYVTDQPPFLNMVLHGETALAPDTLLIFLKSIEQEMGREKTIRFGPRVVDIDILLFDDLRVATDVLTIPHPRMAERAFVLIPLADIAPALVIPGMDETVSELVAALPEGGLGRILESGEE